MVIVNLSFSCSHSIQIVLYSNREFEDSISMDMNAFCYLLFYDVVFFNYFAVRWMMWWRSLILHMIGTVEGEAELPLFELKLLNASHLKLHSSVQFLIESASEGCFLLISLVAWRLWSLPWWSRLIFFVFLFLLVTICLGQFYLIDVPWKYILCIHFSSP